MKSLFTLLMLVCALMSMAQTDPGFGGGSTTLNVPASTTVYANQSRAYGELLNIGTTVYFDFENHVGSNFDHTKPFLLVQTEYNGATDNVGFINPYGVAHSGGGEGRFFMSYNVGLPSGFYQVIQVDEYNAAQIDGALTVDAYDPAQGHGGVLCVLVDGLTTFGSNGTIDVTAKGLVGGDGGNGGNGAVLSGTAGATVGLGNYNTAGNDAGPALRTYYSITIRGEVLTNVNLACGTAADLEGLDGGLGTGQVLGSLGTDGAAPFSNSDDSWTGFNLVTGEGGIFTVGGGGRGGAGGWHGAAAGGAGGSGASNGFYDGTTTNTSQKAGPGTTGTAPSAATGFSDADAGDGGAGGVGGGGIFIRSRNYATHVGKKHFQANGGGGAHGQDGHGEGGDGGNGGKGADGYCSGDGSNSQLHPAGGNGGLGKGGNGSDAGSGGQSGEAGCIWIWYDATATQFPDITHCQALDGNTGLGGSGAAPGINGIQNKAADVEPQSCDCEASPVPIEQEQGSDCACIENFYKLKDMTADGTTAGGFKKWSDANGNYCYYDTDTDQLICYEEKEPTPNMTIKRTTKCGAFDCGAWTEGLFDDLHSGAPSLSIAGGEVTWADGINTVSYNFKTGILADGGGQECTKDCDPVEEEENETITGPRAGMDGSDGFPRGTTKNPKIGPMSGLPPLSVKSTQAQKGLEIFPNPAHDVLIVKASDMSQGQFSVINGLGQVFMSGNFNKPTFEIDLTKLDIGLYFVQLSHNGQTLSLPFEKK